LQELSSTQFHRATPIFHPSSFGVLAAGTLEGGHPGRVFLGDGFGLVCTRVGYYFLAGQVPDAREQAALARLFLDELAPQQKAALGDPQILLFYDRPAWQQLLADLFAAKGPKTLSKKRMVLPPSQPPVAPDDQPCPPDGFRLQPITRDLLDAHPDLAGEAQLFWGTSDAFLEKSLGFCVLRGDRLAASCQAVFVGGGEVEISIATHPDYHRQGLARLCAAAFIAECRRRGLRPIWGCWPENAPSVALAHRLGFVDDRDQPICFWED
jgi:GNAT superfamily N-acetyltransferase